MIDPHPTDRPDPEVRAIAARAASLTSDSRSCFAEDLFVALRGERVDGHEFAKGLVDAGAYAIVARGALARLGMETAAKRGRAVEVDDTHRAHRAAAGLFRRRFSGRVVGVGGSSGKTTAKEFLAALLARRFSTAKTDRSQNGELGVPRTLEKLRPGVEVAVVEIGIDAPGDMERHAALVAPEVAALTSIGEEHLNLLGSVENVFREETVLFEIVRSAGGACFAPADDPFCARLRGTPGVTLVPSDPVALDRSLASPLRHPYARRNAALACAVALHLGMTSEEIAPALASLRLPDGRGAERRHPRGALLLLDHYNANPSSLRAGLTAARLRAAEDGTPLRLVLGDMLDLGPRTRAEHEGLVGELRAAGAASLWLVGPEMSRLADPLEGAAPEIRTYADSAGAAADAADLARGPSVVLIKGSRGMALERILEALERS